MDTEPHDIMQILKEFNQEYVLSFWNDLWTHNEKDNKKRVCLNSSWCVKGIKG